ncbi:GerMN domain-containing protein [Actinomycetota bacterium]
MVNRKTKKRKKAPLVRLTILIILILAIGFFIFYSIDNPQFIRDLLNMDPGPEETSESSSEEITTEETSVPIEEEVEESHSLLITETEPEIAEGELSWWQRLLDFFRKRGKAADAGDSYPPRLTVNIYFAATGEEKKLAAEERSVRAGSPENALNSAMNELLKGPSKSYHFPVIPAGTKLLGAKAYDGVAEVDLTKEFLENSLDSRILDEYIIYSIVNTATEIPEINGVIFFIEGKRIKMYGNIDLSIPIIRNAELLPSEE